MARSLQFSATFLAVEDRLQLQGAFPDGTEVRLLLTRRITGGLLSLIEEVSDRLVEPRIAAPEIKKQIAQFSRETAVEQADFAQTFAAGKVHPMMAGGPRLVTEVSVTPHEGEEVTLIFKLDQSERVNMKMPAAAAGPARKPRVTRAPSRTSRFASATSSRSIFWWSMPK